MKRCVLLLVLFFPFLGYAQQNPQQPLQDDFNRNELRLNALFVLFKGIEVSYERAVNRDVSFGFSSLLVSYDKDLDYSQKRNIVAFGRYYFGKNPVSGFFAETFVTFFNRDYYVYREDKKSQYSSSFHNENNFAIGFGIGSKWVKNDFSFELSLGVGRIPREGKEQYNNFIGRGAVAIGYQF